MFEEEEEKGPMLLLSGGSLLVCGRSPAGVNDKGGNPHRGLSPVLLVQQLSGELGGPCPIVLPDDPPHGPLVEDKHGAGR